MGAVTKFVFCMCFFLFLVFFSFSSFSFLFLVFFFFFWFFFCFLVLVSYLLPCFCKKGSYLFTDGLRLKLKLKPLSRVAENATWH